MTDQTTGDDQSRRRGAPAPVKTGPRIDEITYMPHEDGDRPSTVWNGWAFKAHIPVKVPYRQCGSKCARPSGECSCVMVPTNIRTPMRDEVTGKQLRDEGTGELVWHDGVLQPDGTVQTRKVEKPMPMADLAKGNVRFSVNGAPPPVEKKGTARLPTDANQYRGFAMNWMMNAADLETLNARWNNEARLREGCGIASDDLAFLMPFLEMRREQLRPAA
jgi:hypothetical protein